MESTRKRTLITTAVAGAGAAAALGIALAASPAQAEDPTPTPSASSSAPAADKPDREAARAARQDELAAALATELGIDKAKVAAALEKVQAAQRDEAKADRQAQLKTRLDEAVKAGKLTADEAAAILKAAEAGVLPQGGPGGGPGGGHRGGPGR
jgi:membrane-bound lytic murein transglycosylase B